MRTADQFDADRQYLRQVVGEHLHTPTLDRELTAALDLRLRRLITQRPVERPRVWRPWFTVGAVAMVLVATAAVLTIRPSLGGEGAWAAPTPLVVQPLQSPPTLDELADLVEQQPASTRRSIVDWSLWTRVDDNRAHSRIVPTAFDQVVGGDGTIETRMVRGSAIDSDASIEEQTRQLGRLLDRDKKVVPRTRIADIATLPRDTAGLTAFADAHGGQPLELETLTAFKDMFRQEPLPGDLIAAFYRLFALQGQLVPEGATTDRLGRQGIAYQLTSANTGLPTHYILIIDPDTGQPLANETVLFQTSGALNLNIPAVIGYEIYVDRE